MIHLWEIGHQSLIFEQYVVNTDIGDAANEYYNKIRLANKHEQIMSIFAHKKRNHLNQ